MVKIAKPTRKKGKGTAPKMEEAKNNLKKPASNEKSQINFLCTPEWKKELQLFGLENDMNITEVLKEGFELMKNRK